MQLRTNSMIVDRTKLVRILKCVTTKHTVNIMRVHNEFVHHHGNQLYIPPLEIMYENTCHDVSY